jgi:hypothetical protein
MKIKVYVLEFSFFSGVAWKQVDAEITAETKIQLMKAFLKEMECLNQYSHVRYASQREAIKDLWNKNKGYIKETELTFPIVRISS